MPESHLPIAAAAQRLNVADRLSAMAARMPEATAVASPWRFSPRFRRQRGGEATYATISFAELDRDASRLARGLAAWGAPPGARLVLLVRPGIEFVTSVFALLRAGVVVVLVDPGLGMRSMVRALAEVNPDGFVAIEPAQAVRTLLRHRFPRARWNITVGRRWFWGGLTLDELRQLGTARPTDVPDAGPDSAGEMASRATHADDPAAVIFTSGSTGPAKGVLYTQRMFDTQVSEIQAAYAIESGGVDLACFPLFALFNAAMGVTTVFPNMNFSRPASADPRKLLAAAGDWNVTQAFASPAVWRVVGEHCVTWGQRIDSLRQVFSCGAPVGADVLRATLACVAPGARMHTPYGATECLPVATIEAAEVIHETAAKTNSGAGVCVGRPFDTIDWRVIRITDEPIATIAEAETLPAGEIGELIVRGPQASPRYVTSTPANALSKIAHGELFIPESSPQSPIGFWHRMGDVGYLDDRGRFWYCGRKSHRVETEDGTLFTECVEAIFNTHSMVRRSALVGVGKPGRKTPVIVIERVPRTDANWDRELFQFSEMHELTRPVKHLLVMTRLPVDVRHNAKINRERIAAWAAKRLPELR